MSLMDNKPPMFRVVDISDLQARTFPLVARIVACRRNEKPLFRVIGSPYIQPRASTLPAGLWRK